jgi:uncharacterized membrane protein
MLNMSAFGIFHTAIAAVAVVAGVIALFRHGEIGTRSRSGLTYVLFTVATCITGPFIFHHGGFGPPHALAIITLVVLAAAYVAERRTSGFGLSRYVAVLGYSLTLFFHLIPGLTETGTRVPVGDPAFTGPEDPTLKALVGAGFLVYLAGATVQAVRIRRSRRSPAVGVTART